MFVDNTEELAQNKILLLYIINNSSIPLTNAQISEFVLENNYMNYFLIQQFLSELVESKFIEFSDLEKKETYSILQKGKITLKYFEDRIPEKVKNKIDTTLKEKELEYKKEAQVIGDYFKKNETEYIVNLKLIENGVSLFNLCLNVVSKEQAKMICKEWKENPDLIYQDIFSILLKDNI